MEENNGLIFLPVSLGEAVDKLTILDIKLEKIKDDRKLDVQKEYNLLYNNLEKFIIKYTDLYKSIKKANALIWDMMDVLRDGENITETDYLKLCKECIEYNDIRFRIKNKINYVSNSLLKEQKSYKINTILIEINDEIKNSNDFIKPIKYYSFIYDEIIIISNNKELINELSYDKTIFFVSDIKNMSDKKYIKNFIFNKNDYEKEAILKTFDLCEEVMNLLL
jgi:hypothetical protein